MFWVCGLLCFERGKSGGSVGEFKIGLNRRTGEFETGKQENKEQENRKIKRREACPNP